MSKINSLLFNEEKFINSNSTPILGMNVKPVKGYIAKYSLGGNTSGGSLYGVQVQKGSTDSIDGGVIEFVVRTYRDGFLFGFSGASIGYNGGFTLYSWNDYIKHGGYRVTLLLSYSKPCVERWR